eukprot:CCRYP_007430-RA/>CCRYP_007430-RA protein AED:0.43 eAED:0.37 QI:0/0/0/0.66/0/0/3/0/294
MPLEPTHVMAVRRTNIKPRCDGEGRNAANNYYALLAENQAKDDYAIVDLGASDNYLTLTANVKSKTTQHHPIQVTLPDTTTLRSSHKCKLDVPLPKTANKGYVLPGMRNHSLISVTKLRLQRGILMRRMSHSAQQNHHHDRTEEQMEWSLVCPDSKNNKNMSYITYDDANHEQAHAIKSVNQALTLGETIQCIHQYFFSPTLDTLCKAIENDQLIGAPPITAVQVHKYLPESTATAKGHQKPTRKHTPSTSHMRQRDPAIMEPGFCPPIYNTADFELFIGATIAEQNDGTIYSD